MATIATKDKYHVALNGVGFILAGAPEAPAYSQSQVPIYGARFASGDRSYDDLSQWWFMVQTDFSGGVKDTLSWEDDAKFFSSTNIDTWSTPGSISLARQSSDEFGTSTSTEDILSGVEGDVAGTVYQFVGTDDDTPNGRPQVYRKSGGVWGSVSTTTIDTSQGTISQMLCRLGYLWVFTTGTGTTDVVLNWDGTTWSDKSANIDTQMTGGAAASCRCGVDVDGILYVFMNDTTNKQHALLSTSVANPTVAGDWTLLFERANNTNAGVPVDCAAYGGNVYYLLYFSGSSSMELRAWSITDAVDTLIQKFQNVTLANSYGLGGRLLKELGGRLVITIPPNEIWELDGAALVRIWKKDTFKSGSLLPYVDSGYITYGAILSDNKLWWSNLMYDGEVFYNTFKDKEDETSEPFIPVLAEGSGAMYFVATDSGVKRNLKKVDPTGSTYKSTADSNYVVFNNFDNISGVDKLFHSITILFNKFVSGQSIVVEYSSDEMSSSITWTALGTASYTLDGGSVTFKTFVFGDAVIAKKMWFRVKLNGGGSNTPTLNDFICEYLPFPVARKQWQLRTNLGDELKRLDGGIVDKTGRELRSLMEGAWWTKSILDFQDLDYAETALNGAIDSDDTAITVDSTEDFPEQGRIRIENEEILYTSKTKFKFNGCTRGYRDTRASDHSDNVVVTNAFKVLMTAYATQVPTALEGKNLEYIASISLREV